jgi:hypothetical protein
MEEAYLWWQVSSLKSRPIAINTSVAILITRLDSPQFGVDLI